MYNFSELYQLVGSKDKQKIKQYLSSLSITWKKTPETHPFTIPTLANTDITLMNYLIMSGNGNLVRELQPNFYDIVHVLKSRSTHILQNLMEIDSQRAEIAALNLPDADMIFLNIITFFESIQFNISHEIKSWAPYWHLFTTSHIQKKLNKINTQALIDICLSNASYQKNFFQEPGDHIRPWIETYFLDIGNMFQGFAEGHTTLGIYQSFLTLKSSLLDYTPVKTAADFLNLSGTTLINHIKEIENAAKKNSTYISPHNALMLGLCYQYGHGVQTDALIAAKYFLTAFASGKIGVDITDWQVKVLQQVVIQQLSQLLNQVSAQAELSAIQDTLLQCQAKRGDKISSSYRPLTSQYIWSEGAIALADLAIAQRANFGEVANWLVLGLQSQYGINHKAILDKLLLIVDNLDPNQHIDVFANLFFAIRTLLKTPTTEDLLTNQKITFNATELKGQLEKIFNKMNTQDPTKLILETVRLEDEKNESSNKLDINFLSNALSNAKPNLAKKINDCAGSLFFDITKLPHNSTPSRLYKGKRYLPAVKLLATCYADGYGVTKNQEAEIICYREILFTTIEHLNSVEQEQATQLKNQTRDKLSSMTIPATNTKLNNLRDFLLAQYEFDSTGDQKKLTDLAGKLKQEIDPLNTNFQSFKDSLPTSTTPTAPPVTRPSTPTQLPDTLLTAQSDQMSTSLYPTFNTTVPLNNSLPPLVIPIPTHPTIAAPMPTSLGPYLPSLEELLQGFVQWKLHFETIAAENISLKQKINELENKLQEKDDKTQKGYSDSTNPQGFLTSNGRRPDATTEGQNVATTDQNALNK